MYLARTTVRTVHVLKWRQNRHERCLIEFVYFTFFVHNICIPHNFYAIHKSRQLIRNSFRLWLSKPDAN